MDAADLRWRSTNVGARLFAVNARAVTVKLAVLRARGFVLTEARLALFHALDDAARLTDLAAVANLSKAAMVELVDRAAAAGLVERHPDPADGRGRIVAATAAGRALRASLTAGIAAAEDDAAAVLGADEVAALKVALGDYVAAPGAVCALVPGGAGAAWVAANIGRATGLANRRFVAEVAATVARAGFDASPAMLGMFRHLDLAGSRLTGLAAAARTTKPAMAELVARAVRLGYAGYEVDDTDRRARRIVFTARGRDLLAAAGQGVARAEAAMTALPGGDLAATVARLARLADGPRPAATTDALSLSSVAICHRAGVASPA